jgi:hypothetical protein
MKRIYGLLLIVTAAFLLTNCVNIEMETVVNKDRSGQGKLTYSYDPSKNVEQVDIDETFATIEKNPTVHVTGQREYDSEGTHYREIAWTFKDINEVNLEGLTYSFTEVEGKPVLRAVFEEEPEEYMNETAEGSTAEKRQQAENLSKSVEENNAAALDEYLFGNSPPPTASAGQTGANTPPSAGEAGTNTPNMPSYGGTAIAGTPSGGRGVGLTPEEQAAIDEETQRQTEEMVRIMIRAALDGYSVKFRFKLPNKVLEAPGGKIEGATATWEIPLKDLVEPAREGALDEFKMIMEPD